MKTRFLITPDIQVAIPFLLVDKDIKIVCYEFSDVILRLRASGFNVFSFGEHSNKNILRNSKLLLMQKEVELFINSFEGEKEFIFFRPPLLPLKLLAKYNNPKILNAGGELTNKLENKIFLLEIARELGIPVIPEYKTIEDTDEFPVVVQFGKGYAGISTYFLSSKKELQDLVSVKSGEYKITKFIENGDTFTLNAVCKNGVTLLSDIFYQYTGVPGLTNTKLGSCGNNYFLKPNAENVELINNYTKKIGNYLCSVGFEGFFGVDYLLDDEKLYLVEINPRFTASISFTTQLEEKQGGSLLRNHLNVFSGDALIEKKTELKGKRLLLRNNTLEDIEIQNDMKSGVYKVSLEGFEFLRCDITLKELKDEEVLLFIKPKGFIARPETDIVNLYTLSDISEEILIDTLILFKAKLV